VEGEERRGGGGGARARRRALGQWQSAEGRALTAEGRGGERCGKAELAASEPPD